MTSELDALRATWEAARASRERTGSDADDAAEQAAHDALVDYVEAHGLNGTEHDPRGPLEEWERALMAPADDVPARMYDGPSHVWKLTHGGWRETCDRCGTVRDHEDSWTPVPCVTDADARARGADWTIDNGFAAHADVTPTALQSTRVYLARKGHEFLRADELPNGNVRVFYVEKKES